MRPAILNPLFAEVAALKGVGSAQVRQLARLKISRALDLAFHLPTMVIDRLAVDRVDESLVGRPIVVPLTPARHDRGGPRSPLRVAAVDRGGQWVDLTFFGQTANWAQTKLPIGVEKRVIGKLDRYGQKLQIAHPEVLAMDGPTPPPLREPVYPLTEGITNRRMSQLVAEALGRVPALAEWIEPSVIERQGWAPFADSLKAAHRMEGARNASLDRLAYDELLANQLALLLVRADTRARRGRALAGTGRLVQPLMASLPWALTNAQNRVIGEISGDMAQAQPMLRLLQGDVGSGKTLVGLIAMLTAVEAGTQAALLAPTEILARQHHATLTKLAAGLPVRIELLTGRDKGKAREALLADLAAGRIDILVGTHAIFQEAVEYHDLGLVVVDEQHRFGVAQRLLLANKARVPPHVLAMTATPIPRSLALTRFGEMDQSQIDERPPGRQPIETRVTARFEDVAAGLARHVEGGGQAYWVCPLVDGTEDEDEAAATTRAAFLKVRLGEGKVGLAHGKMKGPDKDAVMADFAAGRLAVLVATTVIEVGVDVPNATLMIIEAAERFGLAQLHQLRGRVGRGSGHSVCLLLRGEELSETARSRLKLMRETNDGFRIAEEDLRLRGAGEILGTRQSGEEAFHFADPERVQTYVTMARDDARLLLDRDGGLDGARGQAARVLLYLFERDAGVALLRSG
ncbi:ATP-dependent DNA helicase RecG [Sandarakinorhabdus oryzae]|uniref:ATP-dependent DNA helicase RecG n=1 Tax=Sandarakinorhabdus oryzae TaxID=2675220 RepID=UPI0012E16528|nr:ATP-dependent DNA helicase RecG [Sandarakinorhabdus oryzae]